MNRHVDKPLPGCAVCFRSYPARLHLRPFVRNFWTMSSESMLAAPVDRCVLYAFRCAVYYAATPDPDPELLKWWNWKDR